jgi:hypothetical protein
MLSIVIAVLLLLIFAALIALAVLGWKIYKAVMWHNRVSTPWFNSIGQKIGLDNASTIPVPPG